MGRPLPRASNARNKAYKRLKPEKRAKNSTKFVQNIAFLFVFGQKESFIHAKLHKQSTKQSIKASNERRKLYQSTQVFGETSR